MVVGEVIRSYYSPTGIATLAYNLGYGLHKSGTCLISVGGKGFLFQKSQPIPGVHPAHRSMCNKYRFPRDKAIGALN